MKLNNIDIKIRLLAKLPSVYGYHKLINSKYHSYTNSNHSSTHPLYKLKNKNSQCRVIHTHTIIILYLSFLKRKKMMVMIWRG